MAGDVSDPTCAMALVATQDAQSIMLYGGGKAYQQNATSPGLVSGQGLFCLMYKPLCTIVLDLTHVPRKS